MRPQVVQVKEASEVPHRHTCVLRLQNVKRKRQAWTRNMKHPPRGAHGGAHKVQDEPPRNGQLVTPTDGNKARWGGAICVVSSCSS